jgi:hypothetical protein
MSGEQLNGTVDGLPLPVDYRKGFALPTLIEVGAEFRNPKIILHFEDMEGMMNWMRWWASVMQTLGVVRARPRRRVKLKNGHAAGLRPEATQPTSDDR